MIFLASGDRCREPLKKISGHPLSAEIKRPSAHGHEVPPPSEARQGDRELKYTAIANNRKFPIVHFTTTTAKDSGAKYGEFLAVATSFNMLTDRTTDR